MKDQHDQQTADIPELAAAAGSTADGRSGQLGKPKRLPQQNRWRQPEGAKPAVEGAILGFCRSVVPVAVVAHEWGISARRVRMMLVEGRLAGRQLENGYWEVFYPYSYVFGTRGPQIKRQRELPPPKPKRRGNIPESKWGEW